MKSFDSLFSNIRQSGLLFWHKLLLLLTGSIGILTIITAVVTWGFLNQTGRKMGDESIQILSEHTETFLEKLVRGQAATLDAQLFQAQSAASFGAALISEKNDCPGNQAAVMDLLKRLCQQVNYCSTAYFVAPSGQLILYSSNNRIYPMTPEVNLTVQDYFPSLSEIQDSGTSVVWSRVHVSSFDPFNELAADAISLVQRNQSVIGYVGISVSLTKLISQFNQHQPVRGAYSFLMDADRRLIGAPPHARLELVPDSTGTSIPQIKPDNNLELFAVTDKMIRGGSSLETVSLGGETKYIAYHPIGTAHWSFGLAVPVKMVTAASNRLVGVVEQGTNHAIVSIVALSVGILFISLFFGILLGRQITLPIRQLFEATKEISNGNFEKRIHVMTTDEIGSLGTAFNFMADEIQTMIKEMNEVNTQLFLKNEQLKDEIIQRRRLMAMLEESEARFKSLSENAPDIIFMLDSDNRLIYVNPAFETVLGYPQKEALNRMLNDFTPNDEEAALCRRFYERIRETKETIRDMPVTLLHRNLSVRQFIMSGSPEMDAAGNVSGIVGLGKDITEQKRMEKHLQNAQRMESIGTLAGGIAHDFNNLMMAIQGNISLILLQTEPEHPNYKRLKNIESYIESGAELTRQLLGFARGGKFDVKPINICKLLDRILEMFERTRKEIQIIKHYSQSVLTIEADAAQMEQVFLNLLVNASDAMPEGGTIYIQTENVVLDANYMKPYNALPGRYVKISVTDTGIGIEKEIQQKIFEPFFTTKERGRGTGLGLASVYGIIRNHNGIINLYSEKGKGTTFNIYLPHSDKIIPDETPVSQQLSATTGTLLIIDDEEMILEVSKEILETIGYEVLTAKNGTQAIEIYQQHHDRIDIIILDMIMPGMSGGETFDQLQTLNPDVKVILSSGYSLNGQAAEIMKRGCKGFIQKPFNLKQLTDIISSVLNSGS